MKRTVIVFLVGPRDAFLVFRAIIPAMQRTRREVLTRQHTTTS